MLSQKLVSCRFLILYILVDGNIYAWGCNKNGQLGTGQSQTTQPTPKLVMPLWRQNITHISASRLQSTVINACILVFLLYIYLAGDVFATPVVQETILSQDPKMAKFIKLTPSNSFAYVVTGILVIINI